MQGSRGMLGAGWAGGQGPNGATCGEELQYRGGLGQEVVG